MRGNKLSPWAKGIAANFRESFPDVEVPTDTMLEVCGVAKATKMVDMTDLQLVQYALATSIANAKSVEVNAERAIEQKNAEMDALLRRPRAQRRRMGL